jgi:DNA-directed RNA polymerase subunit omega
MMVKPSVTELLKRASNRYELVIATSRRARQIVDKRLEEKAKAKSETGNEPLNKEKEEPAVTIAANEIAEGKVKIEC